MMVPIRRSFGQIVDIYGDKAKEVIKVFDEQSIVNAYPALALATAFLLNEVREEYGDAAMLTVLHSFGDLMTTALMAPKAPPSTPKEPPS